MIDNAMGDGYYGSKFGSNPNVTTVPGNWNKFFDIL